MSDNDKYTLDDIINFSTDQRPVDVKAALDDLMIAKIHSAIEDKKVEVAKQMFGDASGQNEIDDPDDNSDETEDEWEDEEEVESDDTDESDDFDMDISDEELEDLLNDLEDSLEDDDLEDDLEVDNLDSEEDDNGENA